MVHRRLEGIARKIPFTFPTSSQAKSSSFTLFALTQETSAIFQAISHSLSAHCIMAICFTSNDILTYLLEFKLLARQQAQREEELAQSQRHILALQEELEELERENRLHSQQEAMLKDEVRNMERMQKREGVDMTYLKNVIVKLLETGEVEALLPVVGMLLQFTPDEMQKCHQAYRSSTDVPPSPASDSSGSALSVFSRFSFS